MIDGNRQVAIDPLIVKVVVHADDIDVVRSATQLRTVAP